MEYFSFEEQRILLFVTLTYVTVLLATAWVVLIELRGCGMWNWLNPTMTKQREEYRRIFFAGRSAAELGRRQALGLNPKTCRALEAIIEKEVRGLPLEWYIENIVHEHLDRYADLLGGMLHEDKIE